MEADVWSLSVSVLPQRAQHHCADPTKLGPLLAPSLQLRAYIPKSLFSIKLHML